MALWTEPGVRRFLFDDQVISREQVTAEIIDRKGRRSLAPGDIAVDVSLDQSADAILRVRSRAGAAGMA